MPKLPLRFKPNLFILVHGGSGTPYAMRLNLSKLSIALLVLGCAFFIALTGSLCFFRELEINRKLTERVLEFETKERLAKLPLFPSATAGLSSNANQEASTQPKMVTNSLPADSATEGLSLASVASTPRDLSRTPMATTTKANSTANSPAANSLSPTQLPSLTRDSSTQNATEKISQSTSSLSVATNPTAETLAPNTVQARIGELGVECFEEDCEVRLSMVPTRTGVAQGELLVVLETEIPRIGAGNPSTQMRKRYFIYPGNETRDEFSQELINEIARKSFRFTRGLQTSTSFAIGKLLRPLAVNIYLFDKEKTLIHHERKSIEREEP